MSVPTYYMCTEGHLCWDQVNNPPQRIKWCKARVYADAQCGARCRGLTPVEEAAFRLGGAEGLREVLTGYDAIKLDTHPVRQLP